MSQKTDLFFASVLKEYTKGTAKLGQIGNTYRQQMKNKEVAEENLMKVYHGYTILSWVLAFIFIVLPFWLAFHTHNNAWITLVFLAYGIPFGLRWSIRNVLNITPQEYADWTEKKKNK